MQHIAGHSETAR